MSLQTTFDALDHDLTRDLPRSTRSFAEARARHRELVPFETVGALRRALDPSSTLGVTARRRVIAALVAEAQQTTPSVASALLVLAFAPMLHGLRKKTGSVRPDPDLDGAILAEFTAAIRTVRPGPYTSLALRWATEREVVTDLRADRRLGTLAQFDESIHSLSPFHESRFDARTESILRTLEREGVAEILDVLVATRAHNESLRDYVARTCPNPREQSSRYKQLYHARRCFERALRKRFSRRAA